MFNSLDIQRPDRSPVCERVKSQTSRVSNLWLVSSAQIRSSGPKQQVSWDERTHCIVPVPVDVNQVSTLPPTEIRVACIDYYRQLEIYF